MFSNIIIALTYLIDYKEKSILHCRCENLIELFDNVKSKAITILLALIDITN